MRNLSIIAIALTLMMACSSPSPEVVTLNKQDFITKVFDYEKNSDWAYAGKKPCVIDFYADWCAPCKRVSPILKELAGVYKNQLVIYKVDVDAENELAGLFGIEGIPALLFVPVSGEPQMKVGALNREQLVAEIDKILGR
ncbi:MAG: thiol reductase thioredoxin [Tannerellaceae bacterium]|jgi:thioredoxin|nr:thiol reductase thioredoxin [Tannerellaceae bacterium]